MIKNFLHNGGLYWASWAALISGFALVITIITLMFFPSTPAEYVDQRFEVDPVIVKAGTLINVHLRYQKYVDTPAQITVSFVDTIITDALTYTSLRKAGYYDHWRKIHVPKALTPGRYFIVLTAQYKINSLRNEKLQTRSIFFDVVE